MINNVDKLAKELGLHSDRIRGALNHIPGELLVDLPYYRIRALVRAVDTYAEKCVKDYVEATRTSRTPTRIDASGEGE